MFEDDAGDALPSGTVFGPFLIRRPLGRGGMAAVYEALDTRLERAVALKVLPPEFLRDPTSARRFETETRLIARLEHPNIVPIYAGGIEAGIPWMSMRLLAGNNLSVLLEQRRLAPAEAVQLLRQAAAALDYAHAHGVVHRDIKPSNILLDASGAACVADFGLAQMMESSNRLTQTGILTGTPHYMAPEQALGKRVDHRCDIYSLGIVAYEMLTGARPFTAESPVALLLKHVHEPLPVPADSTAGSRGMDAIRRATAKDPEDRWPSAGAFVDTLESSIGAARLRAADTTGRSSGRLLSSRGGVWAAVGATTLVAVIAGAWLATRQPRFVPPEPPSSSAVAPKQEAVSAPAAVTPSSSGVSDGGRPGTTTQAHSRKPAVERAQTTAQPASSPPQPSPDPAPTPPVPADAAPAAPAPAAAQPASGPPPNPVTLENPVSLAPSTGTPAVAAPPRPAPDVLIAPEPIRKVKHVYPQAAVSAELEGEVTLAGVIGIDGKVSNITVVRKTHPLFIEAARNAWLQWVYTPGRRNGVPEPTRSQVTFTFKLDK